MLAWWSWGSDVGGDTSCNVGQVTCLQRFQ